MNWRTKRAANRFWGICILLLILPLPAEAQSSEQLYTGGLRAFEDGLWTSSISQFSRLLRTHPDDKIADTAAYMQAVAYLKIGKQRKSLSIFKSFLKKYPASVWNRRTAYWEGEAYYQLREWESAAAAFKRQSKIKEDKIYREESLLYMGVSSENLGNWSAAEQAYSDILAESENYEIRSRAVFRLGRVNLVRGNTEAALKRFNQLLYDFPLAPAASDVHFWIAETYLAIGREKDALENYRNFIENVDSSPNRTRAILEAANLSSLSGDNKTALAYLDLIRGEASEKSDTDEQAFLRIQAGVWLKMGELEKARDAYTAILKKTQDQYEKQAAAFNLAQTWVGTSKAEQALPWLKRAQSGPNSAIAADALYWMGALVFSTENKEGLKSFLQFIQQYPDDPRREGIFKTLIKYQRNNGLKKEAMENLKRLIREYPESSEAASYLFLKSEMALESGNVQSALTDYAAVTKRYSDSPYAEEAESRMGDIYAERGEHVRAAGYYKQAAALAADRGGEELGRYLYSAGVAYFNGRQYEKAVDQFDRVLKIGLNKPWSMEAAYYAGEALYGRKNYSKSRKYYTIATGSRNSKLKFRAFYGIGWTWFRQLNWGKSTEAFKRAADAASSRKDKALAFYRTGLSTASAGNLEKSLIYYNAALQQGGGSWREEVLYQKAWVLMNLGLIEQASNAALSLEQEFPRSRLLADLPFRMGATAMDAGEYATAIKWYDKVSAQYPASGQASRAALQAARATVKSGNLRDAANRYERWIKSNLDNSAAKSAVRSWAALIVESGDPILADKAWNSIQTLLPANERLTAPIILAWARVKGIPSEAKAPLERMAENKNLHQADRAEALLLLADRFRKDGEFERSREVYEILVKDVPGRIGAEAQMGLAQSYAAQGKASQAGEAYLALSYLFPEQKNLVLRALNSAERLYRREGRVGEADKIRTRIKNLSNNETRSVQ